MWLRHLHDMQQNCYICIRVAQMFKLSDIGRKWKLNFVNWYSTFRDVCWSSQPTLVLFLLRGLSPRANDNYRAAAAGRRS